MHIHTALSPCGDNDMTPNNIVNMSILKNLDIIAITDHNSCANCEAVIKAAGNNLLVIPGIEVETSEEVHVVCYFPSVAQALLMEEVVKKSYTPIKNRPEIFGEQLIMNHLDEVIKKEENLLVTASGLSIYQVVEYAKKFGGVAIPAHIDRTSYSVLSNLGFIPPDLDISCLEITAKNRDSMCKNYNNYLILTNSDAHYLENISERYYFLELSHKNARIVIDFLCKHHQI